MARIGRSRDEQGFTLVEMLVCILIIGIMVAIALPAFLDQRAKGEDTEAKLTLKNAATALITYEMSAGTFDATIADLVAIEPSLIEARDLQVTGTPTTFVVSEESADLTRFTMTRDASGRLTRTCTAPGYGLCRADVDAQGNRW